MVTRSVMLATVLGLAAACMGGVPGPGGGVPNISTCTLITVEEMSAIWGEPMTVTPGSDNSCAWAGSDGLPAVDLRLDATDLATARNILGEDANVTVAGKPAVIGTLFGILLYVQHGAADLVVQTVLLEDTPDNRQKVIRVGETAVPRLP